MQPQKPLFIADSCIGGLSVLKSIWSSGNTNDAVFLADYAINPLGVKKDSQIAEVAANWLTEASKYSDTLIIGCNTLSIRYYQLPDAQKSSHGLKVVSMVDCFKEMVKIEADKLTDKKVLIIGTAFTASQPVYSDILNSSLSKVQVEAVAATELERSIARFQVKKGDEVSLLSEELKKALETVDVAMLACTCFPMVKTELESLYPGVTFLDPGTYCAGLLDESDREQTRNLDVIVTGSEISNSRVSDFAEKYLRKGAVKL